MHIKIAPSILSADFSILGQEVSDVSKAGADYLHIDIMDGNFVPNITIGPKIVSDIRKHSNIPFDTHLMISNPAQYIEIFAEAGSDILTFHYEATRKPKELINIIKSCNKKVGISLKPSTPKEVLDDFLEELDLILVMTVNPGFGGQTLLVSEIEKIKYFRKKINESEKDIKLEVDGGINDKTAKQVIEAGAEILVSGSYIFKASNKYYKQQISTLKYA